MVGLAALAGCRISFDPRTGDAGTSTGDAAITRDGADATSDACATALLCDDFDTGIATSDVRGMVQHDPTGGRDGGGIMRTQTTGSGVALAVYPFASPIASGTLYARSHVKVLAGAPVVTYAVLIQMDNLVDTMGAEKVSADVVPQDRFSIVAPWAGGGAISPTQLTRDRWTCLELAIAVDAGTAGTIELRADGTSIASTAQHATMPPGGFKALYLGLSTSPDEGTIQAWFDDLVVSTMPTGC